MSFAEATQLFQAEQDYLEIYDSVQSENEDRFIAIGEIERGVAVVVYTEREDDVVVIIGARFATRRERERFRDHMGQDQ